MTPRENAYTIASIDSTMPCKAARLERGRFARFVFLGADKVVGKDAENFVKQFKSCATIQGFADCSGVDLEAKSFWVRSLKINSR